LNQDNEATNLHFQNKLRKKNIFKPKEMLKIIALTFIFYFKLANHLETLNKNIFKPKEMLKNSIIDLLYFIFS